MSMTNEAFDELVTQLQSQAFADARAAYGEVGFERWRNPRFNGPLENSDAAGGLKGGCGDTIHLYLKFKDQRVEKASYTTDGCASSSLCGSFTAELAHGRTPEELLELEPADVLNRIGTFPEGEKHCATLAIKALQEAVNNYMISVVSKNRQGDH
ncbi:MAG: iron-sulfur cluster assembly scaffold protein [Desulfocapsaceae bacterium]